MNIKNIYKKRFDNIRQRDFIWKVLVNDFFQKYIKKDDVVLDVGCGYGEFINNINCRKKLAIDINPDVKKYLNKNVIFHNEPSAKLSSIKSNSINKIFVSNFFEHLDKKDITATIGEFKRVLKKGGLALVLQPNIRLLLQDYWMFFDHVTPIDDRALEEVFNLYDFELIKKILRFLPYTTKSNFPKSAFFVSLYLKIPLLWSIFGKQSFLIFQKL